MLNQVRYRWSFLVGDVPTSVKRMPKPKPFLVSEEELNAGGEKVESDAEDEGEKEIDELEKEEENVREDSVGDDKEEVDTRAPEDVEPLEVVLLFFN